MTMKHFMKQTAVPVVLGVAVLLALTAAPAAAGIDGIQVNGSIDLYARTDYINSSDGASIMIWGLTDNATTGAQYPAPTLIFNQGDYITITLHNNLAVNTSLIFPGHDVAGAGGCSDSSGTPAPGPGDLTGRITCEAAPGGSAIYSFPAEQAGTYLYHSGTDPALQIEMGLFGAIIVRPYGYDELNPTAYGHPGTAYDREYLFLFSEMDSRIHEAVEFGESLAGTEILGDYFPNYWFINGRTGVDTLFGANASWLPTQPYSSLALMEPGEKLLARVATAGRDPHPFHTHGNHATIIGRNGRMPESAPGMGPDLGFELNTIPSYPGETFDAVFGWTGENMGWDIYGTPADGMPAHDCIDGDGDGFGDESFGSTFEYEWCDDHGKPFPVTLPENLDLAFGAFWSGSPFMGAAGALPPGEGGLNVTAGYTFMWHSHAEKELCNNDIFPGGLLTLLVITPPGTLSN
jgi:FtsP/CotA-like multicopper oxidase with cupredoxin domain